MTDDAIYHVLPETAGVARGYTKVIVTILSTCCARAIYCRSFRQNRQINH